MSPFRISTFLVLFAGTTLSAQNEPATDRPVILDRMVVTATPFARDQAELTSATGILSGTALLVQRQASLGETLAGQVGLSATGFSAGASRPIVRGLGGERIRILQNGIGTIDASGVSPDHAVSGEPFLVKSIEIVRGPASLLYGSSAVGGVINVVDHRIQTERLQRDYSGEVLASYGTGAEDIVYGGIVDLALFAEAEGSVILHVDGAERQTDDVRIPGFARTAAQRAQDAADGEPAFDPGSIANSAVDSHSGAVGLSYVSDAFNAGFATSIFATRYGVPAETDVEIDLHQRRFDFSAEAKQAFGVFTGAKLKVGLADYEHQELDLGVPATTFATEGYDARLDLLHAPLSGMIGTWGVQAVRSEVEVLGDELFLPPAETFIPAVFLFEEIATGAMTWQFGARVEQSRIDADHAVLSGLFADSAFDTDSPFASRRYREEETSLGFSAGAIWTMNQTYAFALSATHTERAATVQEHFAWGPHIATAAFEIGDPDLNTEKSLGVELSLRKREGFITGAINLFTNRFDRYIFEQATGLDHTIDVGDDMLADTPDDETLPELAFVQRDVNFYGVEIETVWHLHAGERHALDLEIDADATVAEEDSGDPLPRIPPYKGRVGVVWESDRWSLGADCRIVAAQTRNAPGETETDGYTLLSVYATRRFTVDGKRGELFMRGSNLANEEARLHTSFTKDYAPLAGRSLTLGLQTAF